MLATILMLIGALGGHAISKYCIMDHLKKKKNPIISLFSRTSQSEKSKFLAVEPDLVQNYTCTIFQGQYKYSI